ncbi:MAG: helix-turn-helix domain-containing protein [Anaeroplasma sp.]
MDKQKFGALLVELRKENNLTQQAFAEIFHVSFQAVSKWENGESLPDITTLEQISKFYGISINNLLNGEREKEIKEEKEKVIEEKEEGDNKNLNSSFSLEFVKKRIPKLITCSITLFFYLILCCLPVFNIYIDYGYISVSYYQLVFSSNFLFGNFILLVSFLAFITSCVIGIISNFYIKNVKLIKIEEILLIGSYIFFLILWGINGTEPTFGLFFLTACMTIYLCCFLFLKSLNYNSIFVNSKQLLFDSIGFFSIIFLIIFNQLVSGNSISNVLISIVSLTIFMLSLVLYIMSYFKNKKKIYIIQVALFITSTVICIFAVESITVLLIAIYYIVYSIVRPIRMKKYNRLSN